MFNYPEKLKQELAKYLGLKNVILFSSCRNALYTLLLSLQLKETDEIIIQKFICDSLPLAIRKAGAKPVLVEVNEETFNLDLNQVKDSITPNTKAIIFVHTYGNPSGIMEIKQMCEKHNLILIEDIAHAWGARYNGQLAGTFGDYAVYSFTKQMINFGGGALITNKNISSLRKLMLLLSRKASIIGYFKRLMASAYEAKAFLVSKWLIKLARKKSNLKQAHELDSYFNCTALEAFLALWQIKKITKNIAKRKRNYQALAKEISTQKYEPSANPSYNYLSLRFNTKEERNTALIENSLFLSPWPNSKISSRIAFVPNSPHFSKAQLTLFVETYKKALYNSRSGYGNQK